MSEGFEARLTGGHPNSLGNTVEVFEAVLADPVRFEEAFACYRSEDEVVRLRTSSVMKRISAERLDLLVPYIDRFINEIGALDQASAQWTLAILFDRLKAEFSPFQHSAALAILKRNLAEHDDWIVLNTTIDTLAKWARDDDELRAWLMPHLERLSGETRKSVSRRAQKALMALS